MRRTIHIPEGLVARLDKYIKAHESLALSSVVQRSLEEEVEPPDLEPLLELAGFVAVGSEGSDDRPVEDRTIDRER